MRESPHMPAPKKKSNIPIHIKLEAWDRMPSESDEVYEIFEIYRDLGQPTVNRAYQEYYKKNKEPNIGPNELKKVVAPKNIVEVATKNKWVQRTALYKDYLVRTAGHSKQSAAANITVSMANHHRAVMHEYEQLIFSKDTSAGIKTKLIQDYLDRMGVNAGSQNLSFSDDAKQMIAPQYAVGFTSEQLKDMPSGLRRELMDYAHHLEHGSLYVWPYREQDRVGVIDIPSVTESGNGT